MSKRSQWIANSLFILSCLFLPWRNLGGPFGGHTASEGHFAGYGTLFNVPEGLALDSLLFMLQLVLIGAILLWTETLIRSDLRGTKDKYIGFTFFIAIAAILFPPTVEIMPIAGTLGEIEDVLTGFGFLLSDVANAAPKYIVIELIALFGLMTLAMKIHTKRIQNRPVLVPIPNDEAELQDTNSAEEDSWNSENAQFA